MELTKENKKYIDNLSYEQLLSRWRSAPSGDLWFQGETGEYWGSAMNKKKEEIRQDEAVRISKDIGWN
jgi:hypothetical protein